MTRSVLRSIGALVAVAAAGAQAPTMRGPDKIDQEYTKQIQQFLRDPRISTEYVDYLPASATVPTPMKGFGHIIGAWGILDKSETMNAYLASLAKAAPARS
jgi:hypothetical protein